jgi:hypothetical protein
MEYTTHTTPTEISATSRCALKIKDTYYTVEASESRRVVEAEGIDLDKEYELLFDEINSVVDKQCSDIIKGTK